MRIAIDHTTNYIYDAPTRYGVQELRMTPQSTRGQDVVSWIIEAPGIEQAGQFRDAWGNRVHLLNQIGDRSSLAFRVIGIVETKRSDGIVGTIAGEPAARIFTRHTALTTPDRNLRAIAASLEGRHKDHVALYHALMQAIVERMKFDVGATDARTTAGEALSAGHGVCQDFAHVFIAICRILGHPARYVTGYLATPEAGEPADAHHAWAEADIPGLGWVGFDPANEICPDERYVRLACGPDAGYAAPVRGVRRGFGGERLTVSVTAVEMAADPEPGGQSQFQQQ